MTSPSSTHPTTVGALMAQILRRLAVATAVVTVLGVVAGLLLVGMPGLWGAVIGGAIGVIFCLTTVITMKMSEGRSPQFLAAAVLGGWLAKMAVIIVILAVIKDLTFYDRVVLVVTLVAIVLASLVIEMLAVRAARIPVVEPAAGDAAGTPAPQGREASQPPAAASSSTDEDRAHP